MKNVESLKFDGKRFTVVIDGVTYKKVLDRTVMECALSVGEISDEKFEEFLKTNDADQCFDYTMAMLARKPRTEKEVRRKLYEKGYRRAGIEAAVEKAKRYGYISDEAYAVRYAEGRASYNGKRKIRAELALKGVSAESIESALLAIPEEVEEETALKLARKKLNGDFTEKSIERAFRYLVGKGISYEAARKAVFKAVEEGDD